MAEERTRISLSLDRAGRAVFEFCFSIVGLQSLYMGFHKTLKSLQQSPKPKTTGSLVQPLGDVGACGLRSRL